MTDQKPEQAQNQPGNRQFRLQIRSRNRNKPDVDRIVTLWADLGVFEDLKNDPVEPLDLLGDVAALERVALDKFTQGRLFYAFSDAQDLDPVEFARGVATSCVAEAIAALRGALLDFFLNGDMPDVAQAMEEGFKGMKAMRLKLAETAKQADISGRIVQALDADNVDALLDRAVQEIRDGLNAQTAKISKPGTPG